MGSPTAALKALHVVSSNALRAVALLLLLSALWGGSFVFIKVAVDTIPPATVAFARQAVAVAALLAIVYARGESLRAPRAVWLAYIAIGILGNTVPFVLIHWAETKVDSGLTAILMSTAPLFTMALAHVWTSDERLTPTKILGILVGLCGIVVLVGWHALSNFGTAVIAELAVTLAALGYAFTNVASHVYLRGIPATTLGAGMLLAGTISALPASLIFDAPWRLAPSPGSMAAVLALGLVATAAGYVVFFRLVITVGATFAALSNYLVPVLAIVAGAIFLAERPSLQSGLALVLILGGVALTSLGIRNRAGGAAGPITGG
jgi:drug/metabolite transporter (DMT)-like permease